MKKYFTVLLLLSLLSPLLAQKEMILSLDDALRMAQNQSLQAFYNKHSFLLSYWENRSFKAKYLPSITLNTDLLTYSNRSRLRYNSSTQTDDYVRTENLSSDVNIKISQKVGLTGGSVYLISDLGRVENYGSDGYVQYSSTPFRIGYSQNLFGVNSMKWDLKISPMEFEKAKLDYIESVESMNISTVVYFFQFAVADKRAKMAEYNYEKSASLLDVAQKRFKLGSVTKDELLDLKLSKNNYYIALLEAKISLRKAEESFITYLMLPADTEVKVLLPNDVPELQLQAEKALEAVMKQNPQVISNKIALLQATQSIEEAKVANRFSADVSFSVGVSKDDGGYAYRNGVYGLEDGAVGNVYKPDFEDYQNVNFGISIPILDWGKGRGQIQMAKSRQQLKETSIRQTMQELEKDIITRVLEFNVQKDKVESAALSDTLAVESFELTMERFRRGSADVLKLVSSQKAKDNATVAYISALSEYWSRYYALRKLTLTNLSTGESLHVDFEQIIKNMAR